MKRVEFGPYFSSSSCNRMNLRVTRRFHFPVTKSNHVHGDETGQTIQSESVLFIHEGTGFMFPVTTN